MVILTYFVHGTTKDNERGISSGAIDVPLSELGIKQSHELKEALRGKKFDVVFSSDLKRAVMSAKLVFGKNVMIMFDKRLRECNYGKNNGDPSEDIERVQEKRVIEPFPYGESYRDVEKRMRDFVSFLKKSYQGKHVAIVSHRAPQLALEVILNGKTWRQAFSDDWRKEKKWQAGWEYEIVS